MAFKKSSNLILHLHSNTPTLTSNWVSRLFFTGHANGVIEINPLASGYFFKGEKSAAFQLRSPPAGEANALFIGGLVLLMLYTNSKKHKQSNK